MQASTITKTLAAASANGIATSQSLGAAGNLNLNGATVSGGVAALDTQRRVIITSAGNDSGLTWMVIGTNEGGSLIKDQFSGANAGAAQSNLDFLTVTQISSSGATAGTVTAGTNSVGSSPWKLFDNFIGTPNASFDVAVIGTVNYSVEYTDEAFLQPISPNGSSPAIQFAPANPNPTAIAITGLSALSAAAQASISNSIHAWRLTINSGTGAAVCVGRQSGLRGG